MLRVPVNCQNLPTVGEGHILIQLSFLQKGQRLIGLELNLALLYHALYNNKTIKRSLNELTNKWSHCRTRAMNTDGRRWHWSTSDHLPICSIWKLHLANQNIDMFQKITLICFSADFCSKSSGSSCIELGGLLGSDWARKKFVGR